MGAKIVQLCILFIMIAVGFYGYRLYRDAQSSVEHVIAYLKRGTEVAPTACQITAGNFDYNISGTLYVSGTKMRADYLLADKGVVHRAHAVVEDGKTLYLWSDDDERAFKMPRDQFFLIQYLEADGDNCTPWLLADDSIFYIPVVVESMAR